MRTWSYTIMGNSDASTYWFMFSELIDSSLTEEERKALQLIPEKRWVSLIEERYEDLVEIAIKLKSRLAYQVLGVFLMKFGVKITNALKELILINSRWEDEKDQLFNEKDRAERFYYISEFCKAIQSYKEGVPTNISCETQNQVVEKLRKRGLINTNYPLIMAPDRTKIDYYIKKLNER
ncbi:MAG: hypothetical protein ACFFAI_17315 [Promethearchaeota archaeon]